MGGWVHHLDPHAPIHCWPLDDLVDHDTTGEGCVCGPTVEPVKRADGTVGWLIGHHSLDGRELEEAL